MAARNTTITPGIIELTRRSRAHRPGPDRRAIGACSTLARISSISRRDRGVLAAMSLMDSSRHIEARGLRPLRNAPRAGAADQAVGSRSSSRGSSSSQGPNQVPIRTCYRRQHQPGFASIGVGNISIIVIALGLMIALNELSSAHASPGDARHAQDRDARA